MRAWLVLAFAACSSPVKPVVAPPPPRASAVASTAAPAEHTAASEARTELEAALAFEGLARWTTRPEGTSAVDTAIVHGGHGAIRIERTATTPGAFTAITDRVPIDFSGSTIELRGFLRTDDVRGNAGLWLREDDEGSVVQFASTPEADVQGTTEWKEYKLSVPIDPKATRLVWGALLNGEGTAWADDFQLLVDGKPIWDAPYRVRPQTPFDRDHQFDHGSGITLDHVTPQQIENVTLLGKVWGFLKYHHPKVTAGQVHWDYEMLRVLPAILAANDRATAEAALVHWIDGLGAIAPCRPCATLDEHDLALGPDLAWLDDREQLGAELGARLHAIYAARVPDRQFYVALAQGVGNPQLLHESTYADVKLPDPGFQLLGLFRLWNAVEYWAPDRALADSWQPLLAQLIPSAMLAATPKDYALAMMVAIAKLHDTHANLWSSLDVRPPDGACKPSVALRFVGKRPVVATADPEHELAPGDVITSIDGASIDALLAQWMPYYAGSNDASRLRDIAGSMLQGPCGDVTLAIDRRGTAVRLKLARSTPVKRELKTHDLAGPAFRLLSPEIAYLKLSSVKERDIAQYVAQAAGTKGWIIDIRNYPSEFVVFALGSLFVDAPTQFVRFTAGDLSNPGAFHWTEPLSLEPARPHYGGKVVVLVDEDTQSQAEYTTMAFRAAPRTVVVGSTTAGADGNVSGFGMPGGLTTMFSGLGVFYPDKRPTQGIGIVPDIAVSPTVAGLRAGRDEVLEAGVRAILGKAASAAQIQRIARASVAP